MENHKIEEVGKNCLIKARNYAGAENWASAFPHYLMYFELFPNNKSPYEEEFIEVLCQLGILLELRNQFTEVVKWYDTALRYFPTCAKIANNFGEFLLRTEQSEVALTYLKSACALDSNYLLAEKNLLTAKLNLVSRWHFRMLNDHVRNEAYRTAIHDVITHKNNKVLDIGTGCGLLSFYASECRDVRSVTAVESSNILYTIARNTLKDCNVSVINRYSTLLNSSDITLSNVLVTEIFDAGLFGEQVLETLIHAWDNLLEPSAKIVPSSADLFVTGIASKNILYRHKLGNVISQLGLTNVCVTQRTTEPYEAENIKQKEIIYTTNTIKAIHVDFTNVEQLKQIYTERDAIPIFKLTCIKSETIDAFAIWFDLHLDKNVTITTNPLQNSVTCWEQAIVYLDHPISLREGEDIKLQLSCVANKIEIKILDRTPTCNYCIKVSQEIITFLNDAQMVKVAANLELPDKYKKNGSVILDLNPFPLFAFFMAKKGYPGQYKCMLNEEGDREFINYVWCNSFNSDSRGNFEILDSSYYGNHLLEQSLDIIFLNPISKNGTLCESTLQKLPRLKSALKNDGLIFPVLIKLQVEIIDSQYLNFCNKVDDKNLCGFTAAEHINEYAVLEQWQIEPQYFYRKTLCDFMALYIHFKNDSDTVLTRTDASITANGTANGFLCWFILEFTKDISINTYHSFYYNSSCFIFKNPKHVKTGDILDIKIKQEQGLLKIYCEDDENKNI